MVCHVGLFVGKVGLEMLDVGLANRTYESLLPEGIRSN